LRSWRNFSPKAKKEINSVASSNDKEKKRHHGPHVVPPAEAAASVPDEEEIVLIDPDAETSASDPSSGAGSDDIGKLLAEKQELTNMLVRRQADFENYRKRVEKERQQERHRGVESVIEQILPVLDAIDSALDGPQGATAADYRKGFELVRRQLWDTLTKQGLSRIDSVGKDFDPNFHHAIQQVETADHPEGTVVSELQTGYVFQGRVLRPAMVQVASAPANTSGKMTRAQKGEN
jgi:molecular chaperone GrpE